ncbi:adenomatous polyposis coli protein-like [Oppia nitens]|uniref:adenomatous polyposis coli protein-like n=1 Tax=Oppia nitens TaxID=1686743 RepID=UPI0023DAA315|nr:adenomatous polyposis coli protein-like [Oppia nitens]
MAANNETTGNNNSAIDMSISGHFNMSAAAASVSSASSFSAKSCDEYREVLRKHQTIAVLLDQLKSPAITEVANACLALWDLSALCPKYQFALFELGAVPMLTKLTNSRHQTIADGAQNTLKNLLSSPIAPDYIPITTENNCSNASIPSLQARKIKAIKEDMDRIESAPPHGTYPSKGNVFLPGRMYTSCSAHINPHQVSRSNSRDSIESSHSEPVGRLNGTATATNTSASTTTDAVNIIRERRQRTTFAKQHTTSPIYATLPANHYRMNDNDIDYDIYNTDGNSSMKRSTTRGSGGQSCSMFTNSMLDADPEPTDYSIRYKERPIDDFVAPRLVPPAVATGPTHASTACDDSVKVYNTEGTPLNFSLASSLTDLRAAGMSSIDEEKRSLTNPDFNDIQDHHQHHHHRSNGGPIDQSADDDCDAAATTRRQQQKPLILYNKPTLPPKPKFLSQSTSSGNIKQNMNGFSTVAAADGTTTPPSPIPDDGSRDGAGGGDHHRSYCSQTFIGDQQQQNVTNNGQDYGEVTPMMFSRSSSMSELSDCDVKSDICQSSVVSEFSRLQSQAVSPSDLPDSPLDSPKLPYKGSTLSSQQQHMMIHSTPISGCNGGHLTDAIKTTNNAYTAQSVANNDDLIRGTVFEETPISFATEGTPAVYSALSLSLNSLTDGLSDLNMNMNDMSVGGGSGVGTSTCGIQIDGNGAQSYSSRQHSDQPIIDVNDIHTDIVVTSSSSSSDDDSDVQLLDACISTGMRNISTERTFSRNSQHRIETQTKRTVPSPQRQQQLSPSPVLMMAGNTSSSTTTTTTTKPIPHPRTKTPCSRSMSYLVRSAPDGQSYLDNDTLTTYATEATPCQLSHASSLSQLSISTTNTKSEQIYMNTTATTTTAIIHQSSDDESDDNDVDIDINVVDDSDDDEELLQSLIESGRSASRSQHNTASRRTSRTAAKRSPKTPKTTPIVRSPNNEQHLLLINNNNNYSGKDHVIEVNGDQSRQYCEDTPVELTRCHSPLSALSLESGGNIGEDDDDDDDDDRRNDYGYDDDHELLYEVINRGMIQTNGQTPVKQFGHKRSDSVTNDEAIDSCDENTVTYTICRKNERQSTTDISNKLLDNLKSSAMMDSVGISELDNVKPPSIMDGSMFSSTESFSWRQVSGGCGGNGTGGGATYNKSEQLDNVKPPSIMDNICMTQSVASTTSEISDIAYDNDFDYDAGGGGVVSQNEVTKMAKLCAQQIGSLTYLADTSESETFAEKNCRLRQLTANNNNTKLDKRGVIQGYDLSDSETGEDLPLDKECPSSAIQSSTSGVFSRSSSAALLSLESPTICADVIADFAAEDKQRLMKREKEIILAERRFSPVGSEDLLDDNTIVVVNNQIVCVGGVGADDDDYDESDRDSRCATYNINSPRRAKIIRPVVRNKSKEAVHELPLVSAPIPHTTSSSAKNKYTAKQTRTSALRACRSRSADTHLNEEYFLPHERTSGSGASHSFGRHSGSGGGGGGGGGHQQYISYTNESCDSISSMKPPLSASGGHKSSLSSTSDSKSKNKSWFMPNSGSGSIRSKLTTSVSSHTLGSSNASLSSTSSNGMTPSCASFSRRGLEVPSRIASLWKRSKSVSNDSKADKNSTKKSDLSRSISARRSFGKSIKTSEHNVTHLVRNSTFEKLPQSADEANNLDSNGHKKQPQYHRNHHKHHSTTTPTTVSSHHNSDKYDKYNNNYHLTDDKHTTDLMSTTTTTKHTKHSDQRNGNSLFFMKSLTNKSKSHQKSGQNFVTAAADNNNLINDIKTNNQSSDRVRSSSKSRRCIETDV